VPLPKRKINEMFAIADQILGGRRVRAVCEDGDSRLARIPGKMRRRQWVREGDLIVIQPWDFQDEKANVVMRYTKTQSLYLSRKGVLPDIVDLFGMSEDISGVTKVSNKEDKVEEETVEEDTIEEGNVVENQSIEPDRPSNDDDIDSFFG
jgi:translation initiation factor 1A